MSVEDQKPAVITEKCKTSMEILSELFSTFDAEPPLIIKKEKDENKKHKKSKKKHKHKDKKHKKKDKKRKREDSSSESTEIDLAELLIKQERQSPEKKIKLETDTSNVKIESNKLPEDATSDDECKTPTSKITIKNLKFSSIFEATIREEILKNKVSGEEGEISSSSSIEEKGKKKRKKKHKHKDEKSKKKCSNRNHSLEKEEKSSKLKRNSKSPIRLPKDEDYDSKYREKQKSGDSYKYKHNDEHRSKNDFYKERKTKNYDDYKHKYKENSFYKVESEDKRYNTHDRDKDEKWFTKDRYRGYSEHDRDRQRKYRDDSRDRDSQIDKKKLLEIARRNAIQMMKAGNLPAALTLGRQAQEKVLAAIKAGGKTIEELTEFCKTLSRKEELGELSNGSDGEDGIDSDVERAFHHPFQLKDRPTAIIMNIKNSVPLPTKTSQERTAELRIQFPVSSGTQHRKTENEWVPVVTKKTESPAPVPKPTPVVTPTPPPLPIEAPPVIPAAPESQPGPQVFPAASLDPNIDISSIVTQRLSAMRKLQENPYDLQALTQMHRSQREMQTWAESKQQPGQFTGTTGANILTQAELAAGFQAWAKKDQLQNAAPVSGGMGMHLLKKMGWNPGEGLGKEKTGALEPLLLEVKLDKKGLVANEEQKRKQQKGQRGHTVKTLEGKHPVSLLGEFTAKRKLGAPEYTLCLESGPDHKKLFLFKVTVNGMECQPEAASPNKKQAKADAAKLCLQRFGLLL